MKPEEVCAELHREPLTRDELRIQWSPSQPEMARLVCEEGLSPAEAAQRMNLDAEAGRDLWASIQELAEGRRQIREAVEGTDSP
jgi:hypothetical protein